MKRKNGGGETAAELLRRLEADPEWVRQQEERAAYVSKLRAHLSSEQEPILRDLQQVGCEVDSVWDLVNARGGYAHAIPVLRKHLKGSYDVKILEGIARALTVKEARGVAARDILDELKKRRDDTPSEFRWCLANALTVVADTSMVADLQEMVADPRLEDVRERLVKALKRSREE